MTTPEAAVAPPPEDPAKPTSNEATAGQRRTSQGGGLLSHLHMPTFLHPEHHASSGTATAPHTTAEAGTTPEAPPPSEDPAKPTSTEATAGQRRASQGGELLSHLHMPTFLHPEHHTSGTATAPNTAAEAGAGK